MERALIIMYELLDGKKLKKKELAERFNTSERSIQRDKSYIQKIISENDGLSIIDDSKEHYFYINRPTRLAESDIFAILKIILSSKVLSMEELKSVEVKLLQLTSKDDATHIDKLLRNELSGYTGPQHKQNLIEQMWTFARLIEHEQVIDFEYENDKGIIKHFSNALPVSIIVDTYYVYVVIFYANSKNHFYNYRLDRFLNFNDKNNREIVNNYHDHQELHFNEPKVHKENPLMQIGDVTTATIEFTGILEALKDKFPNSSIIKTDHSVYTIKITANWTSLKMWLLSQGTRVKIVSPRSAVTDYQNTLREMLELNA